jgi:CRP-like cAMP-binding protein
MTAIVNQLISRLPNQKKERFIQSGEIIELRFGDILCEADKPLLWVYFPLTGFISLIVSLRDHYPLEMGLIGNEGMLGAALILGVSDAPLTAMVQGAGTALRVDAQIFLNEINRHPEFAQDIQHYIYVTIAQLAQIAACTHFHEIEPRLARWLLMTHDRAHADHFHLTQEFLANMLGVRRSGVTVAAGILQAKKLIHYSRGEIRILNRKGLENAACECYKETVNDYKKIFNPTNAQAL